MIGGQPESGVDAAQRATQAERAERHLRLVAPLVVEQEVLAPDALEDAPNPARWMADPTRRHEMRFWAGAVWSDRVSDDGVQTVDPVRR